MIYGYDDYVCMLTQTTDSLKNQTTASYDYRFLQPTSITDMNGGVHEMLLDAQGRTVASSFHGNKEGAQIGFGPVSGSSAAGLTVAQVIQQGRRGGAAGGDDPCGGCFQLDRSTCAGIPGGCHERRSGALESAAERMDSSRPMAGFWRPARPGRPKAARCLMYRIEFDP